MKGLTLKEFQSEAVDETVSLLRGSRLMWDATRTQQVVSLSAPTGTGKTIIVTAAMERMLRGDDEVPALEDAVFLWITDQPELNEQSRRKILSASDVLDRGAVGEIDPAKFDQERFTPGRLYFLNTQKLARNANLLQRGDDRTFTMWDTITNTVREAGDRFFLIIDEAHRGMAESPRDRNEAVTIIQKFIKGSGGEIPAIPLILGVSATPERFLSLLEGADGGVARSLHRVTVPPEKVRASGLLKEAIVLHSPSESNDYEITMLLAATAAWKKYVDTWRTYTRAHHLPLVAPLLVVQVENETESDPVSATDLSSAIEAIESVAGRLFDGAYAHAFGLDGDISVNGRSIRKIAPSAIDGDPYVQVVFFKTSLNTGWDCPRAEAVMSYRSSEDPTVIAQLVGRMVRTPLARRIDDVEHLNTVSLFLPHYDQRRLDTVIDSLTHPDPDFVPPVDLVNSKDVVTLDREYEAEDWFAAIEGLPTFLVPQAPRFNQIRRLLRLARALAKDGLVSEAVDDAHGELIGLLVQEAESRRGTDVFESLIADTQHLAVSVIAVALDGSQTPLDDLTVKVAAENVEDLFTQADRKVGQGVLKGVWRTLADSGVNTSRARLEAVALAADTELLQRVESHAEELADEWLSTHRVAINSLEEDRRQAYDPIRSSARRPQLSALSFPTSIDVRVGDETPKWTKHLYVDGDGNFPADLNRWEAAVVRDEIANDDVRWLRSVDRKPWALAVPYQKESGETAPMYPDFLLLRDTDQGIVVDVIDPHLIHLTDAAPKAKGLAKFAEDYGHLFGRIEMVMFDRNENPKRLNLIDSDTRQKMLGVANSSHLQQLYDGL